MKHRIYQGINLLYKRAFFLYKPIYYWFKKRQDAFEIDLLNKYVKQGDNVIDIGGNIGFYTQILSKLVGNKGKVHVFEPDVTNFRHLTNTVKGLSNVILNNAAVADENGTLDLYVSNMLNVDHRTYAHDRSSRKYTVNKYSIDSYLGQNKKVDFIKMDIQGFEMIALKGMEATIEVNPDLMILTELWPHGLQKNNTQVTDLLAFYKKHQLNTYLIENNTIEPFNISRLEKYNTFGEFDFDNVLLTRRNLV